MGVFGKKGKNDLYKLQEEYAELKKRYESSCKSYDELEEENNKLQCIIAYLGDSDKNKSEADQSKAYQERISTLQAKCEKLQSTIALLNEKNQSESKQNAAYQKQIRDLQNKNAELTSDRNTVKSSLENLKTEKEQLEAEIASLNSKRSCKSDSTLIDMNLFTLLRNYTSLELMLARLQYFSTLHIGHNRWNASKLAGKPVVPAVIKAGLSEEEAEMYVIESNLMQRGFDNLRISEQAAVLAMRHKEMFSQGKRNDIIRELQLLENPQLASENEADKKPQTASDKVGAEYGMSRNSVARLLRIDTLHDTIKEWIDAGLSIRAGVELSYIDPDGQELLVEYMQRCAVPETDTSFSVIRKLITEKAAKTLREAFLSGLISEPDDILSCLKSLLKRLLSHLKLILL